MKRVLQQWVCLLVCMSAANLLSAGEVYRWTDEDGQVHFSDKPMNGDAEVLDMPEQPQRQGITTEQDRREKQQRLLRAFEEERIKRREARAKAEQEREQRRRHCHEARDNLRNYNQSGGIYDLDENGERVYMDEEERDAYIKKWRRAVARWCD